MKIMDIMKLVAVKMKLVAVNMIFNLYLLAIMLAPLAAKNTNIIVAGGYITFETVVYGFIGLGLLFVVGALIIVLIKSVSKEKEGIKIMGYALGSVGIFLLIILLVGAIVAVVITLVSQFSAMASPIFTE